jgi:hypothetical protein
MWLFGIARQLAEREGFEPSVWFCIDPSKSGEKQPFNCRCSRPENVRMYIRHREAGAVETRTV